MDINHKQINRIIELSIQEDIANGDISTEAIIRKDQNAQAKLIAKQNGVIAGLTIAEKVFKNSDDKIILTKHFEDGQHVSTGDLIASIEGNFAALLNGERTALNFLQRMSGIATKTNLFVKELAGTKTKLLDTRKTAPGHRLLDKYAVKTGGGENHRIGLFDMVMLKDNHIKAANGIANAVEQVKSKWGNKYKIEVEASNLEEVIEALNSSVDIIMLDNMNIENISEAVKLIGGKCKTEVSGNVTIDKLKQIAETGVDYISVGELTHSVMTLDISMKFE